MVGAYDEKEKSEIHFWIWLYRVCFYSHCFYDIASVFGSIYKVLDFFYLSIFIKIHK